MRLIDDVTNFIDEKFEGLKPQNATKRVIAANERLRNKLGFLEKIRIPVRMKKQSTTPPISIEHFAKFASRDCRFAF
jgi:hypothetical protein